MDRGDPTEAEAPAGGPSPPDGVLARRASRGDRRAFEGLVRRYLRPVHAVAASYLDREADVEDAAQETFLRALDGLGSYDPGRPFAPWLYQIARNVARNRLDRARRWRTEALPEDGPADGRRGPEGELELAEIRRRVDRAVAALPERRRTAFRLVDVEGYAAAEVARLMGLAPGTVRSHVHHARRELREKLGPHLGGDERR